MDARWRFLETHAHRENIQEVIREEIQKGTIRVIPSPGGIRIIPCETDTPPAEPEKVVRLSRKRESMSRIPCQLP
jgi:hypothetical protein